MVSPERDPQVVFSLLRKYFAARETQLAADRTRPPAAVAVNRNADPKVARAPAENGGTPTTLCTVCNMVYSGSEACKIERRKCGGCGAGLNLNIVWKACLVTEYMSRSESESG